MLNAYSPTWFELFMTPIGAEQTERELAFVERFLPLPSFRRVLDLCCGTGRHARRLVERGYEVVGLDRDVAALARARSHSSPGVHYLEGDMRDLGAVPGSFEAVLSLWQSFGYFDDATNAGILEQLHGKLLPHGRLVLDVYHRGFFERHQGERSFERGGLRVVERKHMAGSRLKVHLDYGRDEKGDLFDWRLYTPEELRSLAGQCGFRCLLACADFDEETAPSPERPRMQLVLERR